MKTVTVTCDQCATDGAYRYYITRNRRPGEPNRMVVVGCLDLCDACLQGLNLRATGPSSRALGKRKADAA